jgi:hypothetical protein
MDSKFPDMPPPPELCSDNRLTHGDHGSPTELDALPSGSFNGLHADRHPDRPSLPRLAVNSQTGHPAPMVPRTRSGDALDSGTAKRISAQSPTTPPKRRYVSNRRLKRK